MGESLRFATTDVLTDTFLYLQDLSELELTQLLWGRLSRIFATRYQDIGPTIGRRRDACLLLRKF